MTTETEAGAGSCKCQNEQPVVTSHRKYRRNNGVNMHSSFEDLAEIVPSLPMIDRRQLFLSASAAANLQKQCLNKLKTFSKTSVKLLIRTFLIYFWKLQEDPLNISWLSLKKELDHLSS